MAATDALIATPRAAPGGRWTIVLAPVSHPELAPIHIQESLFAIGRTEAPFDAYPPGLAGDLSRPMRASSANMAPSISPSWAARTAAPSTACR